MSAADDSTTRTIVLDDDIDRMRYRCPRGHASWEPWDSYLWCQSCARYWDDVDPTFDELLDRKENELIPRSEIEFI